MIERTAPNRRWSAMILLAILAVVGAVWNHPQGPGAAVAAYARAIERAAEEADAG